MLQRARPLRVGISGSYGGLNLGDEAILQAIVAQLRGVASASNVTVFSRDAADTRARHRVDRVLPARELSRAQSMEEVRRLDLLIVGGGGILFDGEAQLFLREAMLAYEAGVPVMLYAVGVGPLRDRVAREAVRRALEAAAAVTVREESDRQALDDLGVAVPIEVTADPALLIEPDPLEGDPLCEIGLEGRGNLVAFSVRERGPAAPDVSERDYHRLLADAADFVADRFDAELVFVPLEPRMRDIQESHAVIARMHRARRARVLTGTYTPGEMVTLLERFTFAVGMRLHFLIFSALAGVPFVALPYAAKVSGFLDSMGMAMPPIHQVNAGRLLAHMDGYWDRRRSLQARIRQHLPALRRRAMVNQEIVMRVIAERVRPGRRQHA